MATSLLDPVNIEMIRRFINVYGQGLYERLCDRFANDDATLISTIKRALYGNQKDEATAAQ